MTNENNKKPPSPLISVTIDDDLTVSRFDHGAIMAKTPSFMKLYCIDDLTTSRFDHDEKVILNCNA